VKGCKQNNNYAVSEADSSPLLQSQVFFQYWPKSAYIWSSGYSAPKNFPPCSHTLKVTCTLHLTNNLINQWLEVISWQHSSELERLLCLFTT